MLSIVCFTLAIIVMLYGLWNDWDNNNKKGSNLG